MSQQSLGGMPRPLYPCTPSRLLTWADCPRRYRFAYLDRPTPAKGPPWAHNSVGLAVHNALREWWDLPLAERAPERAAGLVAKTWIGLGFRDDAQESRARQAATEMVRAYLDGTDPRDEPHSRERTVAARTERLAFSGRVDRLDLRPALEGEGAELVVVDYKTGRRPLTRDDTRGSLALALYAVAAARTLRTPCVQVELHHVPTGEVHAHRHTPEALQRHVGRAEALADEAAEADAAYRDGRSDEAFPPRPGVLCGFCDFRAHCPEGRDAAPAREPWAALDDA